MAVTIDELQLEIQASATKASDGIDRTRTALERLRTAVKGGAGLTTATKQFERFSVAVNSMIDPSRKISKTVSALAQLQSIGKSNLGSALNQLKKIPEITKGLDSTTLSGFASKITQVTAAIRPLAVEMEKVSAGFSRLPANIQRAINANSKLTASNNRLGGSFASIKLAAFLTNLRYVYTMANQAANVIGGWIKESNDYVENLNLFTVAMGQYAQKSQEYAEQVGEIMGIDPSQWMRNQGIFMTLATGFGVVSDKAAIMSKNLTQLGYDLSSFFNIPIEDALQKLQSGISGELEPLRRLGYDLSQARLEAIALSLGIDRSVSSMNQAEKSQLRYYAIMTQVTTAQGDMARTLQSPANQIRILAAAGTQASRALGNIFIPALNAILPYAIAFLKVVRTVAQELANLFGFELPEIDYSGLNGIASGAEDADNAIGGAADSAKELKGLLAGFDEINVIQQQPASGGGSGSGGGGGDLGFDLPEYNFLDGMVDTRVNEIFDKMKKSLDRLLPVLKVVGTVLAGILGAVAIGKMITGISNLIKTMGTSGLVGTLAKVKAGALGTAIGFTAGFTTMYLMTMNGNDLANSIAWIAVEAAALSVVMYAMLGPIGIVIAVISVAVGAFMGFEAAHQQLRKEVMDTAFYDNGGIKIAEFVTAVESAISPINEQALAILDMKSSIDQSIISYNTAYVEIGSLIGQLQYMGTVTEESVNKILTASQNLYNQSSTIFNDQQTMLQTYLIDMMERAGETSKSVYGSMLDDLYLFQADGNAYLAGIQKDLNNTIMSMQGLEPGSDAFVTAQTKVRDLQGQLYDFTNATSDTNYAWQDAVDSFNTSKLDFTSTEDATREWSTPNIVYKNKVRKQVLCRAQNSLRRWRSVA